jgi:tRNA pseudouridine55 synthase
MNGIIIVNKPQGFTSQDVVSKIKKILNEKKAGHTGTLDPMATGVLPVLLGNYTKLSKYLIEHNKVYVAKIKLGEKSSTGDSEGEIIEKKSIPQLSVTEIEYTLKKFLGKQKQTPPMYSAIKINGKKLYEYARNGENIEIPEREIEIFSIKLLSFKNDEIEFEVASSKGTYIRTLCEDIAESLGTARLYE